MRNSLLSWIAVVGFAVQPMLMLADRSARLIYRSDEPFLKASSDKSPAQPESKRMDASAGLGKVKPTSFRKENPSGTGSIKANQLTSALTANIVAAIPDPIRFRMQSSKDSVAIGEEFEITITAELLAIPTQALFTFENQKSFVLHVLLPTGFQQTGGTYVDWLTETLTPGNPRRSYSLRGTCVTDVKSLEFTLLRGPANATNSSLFEKKQQLTVFLTSSAPSERARLAASFACTCQDCDLPAVKNTDNPAVSAANRGSSDRNYVQESIYFDASGNNVSQTITYSDGLGRPIQQVNVGTGGTSGTSTDIVTIMAYDAFGREPVKYLPYAVATASSKGAYRAAGASDISTYYAGLPDKSGNAFSSVTYEASPLNRALTQTAPGSTASTSMGYRTNTDNELKLLTYDFSAQKISVSNYAAGQLYVTEMTDENGAKTTEYKDKDGRVVGKDVAGLKTLYGYDDFGWLRCVVPPKASGSISGSVDPFASDLLFAYNYDARGRMVKKKVPGAGATTMTYDNRDRLATTTDAIGTTITTDYDDLNRVVDTKNGATVLTQTYYDSYGSEAKGFGVTHAYGVAAKSSNLKGMVTSIKTLVLGTSTYLTSSTYYDELGRTIQTVADNHKGGVDTSSVKLDYVGRVTENKLSTLNNVAVENRTAYDVGSRIKSVCQRVTDGVTAASGSAGQYWEPVARQSYNGIGELSQKTLGCGIQTIDYTYQLRGWLKSMNNPTSLDKSATDKRFFGMTLAYDGVGNITNWNYANAQRSGNADSPFAIQIADPYSYSFGYDSQSRIKSGNLTQAGQPLFALGGDDNGSIRYDENGNISTLNRKMGYSTLDQLSYVYAPNSNRLASVSDAGSQFTFATSSTYDYDANGNLTKDSGKYITTPITYNYLNLPQTVVYDVETVNYTYLASGQKLKADFGGGRTFDYVAGLVYARNQLEFIPTAEGRVLPPGLASTTVTAGNSATANNAYYRYEYHLKDHLGNLRVACRCGEKTNESSPSDTYDPLVVQEQHYDPFGLDLPGLGKQPVLRANRFKYNGKEQQQGLGWYDYGARMYDPTIGRWNSVDPLGELSTNESAYMYVSGNPIRRIDLFGLTDVDNDGVDDGKTLDVDGTVKAKRYNPNSYFDNMQLAYARNKQRYGHYSPYQQYFQAGGRDAAILVGSPIAAIGAVEAIPLVFDTEIVTAIRTLKLTKELGNGLLAKGAINLLGQYVGMIASNDIKFDGVGLIADIALTNGASSIVGGIGEAGVEYRNGSFSLYRESNSVELGTAKFFTGFAFGKYGDQAKSFIKSNGFSTAVIGAFDAITKSINEVIEQGESKIDSYKKK